MLSLSLSPFFALPLTILPHWYWFLIQTTTNLVAKNDTDVLSYRWEVKKMGLAGRNQDVGKAEFLLEALEVNIFLHLFKFPQVTCIPWLLASPAIFKSATATFWPLLLSLHLLWLWQRLFWFPFSLLRTFMTTLGPCQINWGTLPISRLAD